MELGIQEHDNKFYAKADLYNISDAACYNMFLAPLIKKALA